MCEKMSIDRKGKKNIRMMKNIQSAVKREER
jgi:hypothetical protein